MVLVRLVVILDGLLRFPAAAVVVGQSFPATALAVVEFREKMESVRRRRGREIKSLISMP